jgi:bidirectional [NiFe] hydrogenase diaphorase subunit
MSIVTLTINDKLVSAPTSATLLDAIKEQGIDIPTLCHLKGLSERGGCRLCIVEMEGSPRLFASCVTPVAKGMVVRTHTERLLKYRQMIVELLLAERNHICSVCVQNGHCELQTLAAKLGVTSVRYDYLCPDLPMDASHERYVADHNRCILCGRCNRVCDEVEGAHTLDIGGRGIQSKVISGMNQRWGNSRSCTDCGKCVQVCPTGALFKKGAKDNEKHLNWLMWILDGRKKKHWHWS